MIGISTLRAHIETKHNLEVSTKQYNQQIAKHLFDLQTQTKHTRYLLEWI
ncbi:17609_t:CDS:1, partial [Dentiscutata erythropus]